MLIILFIIFTIIEVVLELLSIIDTEYEDCFVIVIPLAFLTRNKSPPIATLRMTFRYPSDS